MQGSILETKMVLGGTNLLAILVPKGGVNLVWQTYVHTKALPISLTNTNEVW